MSKKRNTACLIIGKNKNWFSSWYVHSKDYRFLFQQDLILYMYLRLESKIINYYSIISLKLFRLYNCILLDIVLSEKFFINKKSFSNILIYYNKFFKKFILMSAYFIDDLKSAFYIAIKIANFIEKRIKFRSKVIKQLLKKAKNNSKGVYVQVNGRINNVDMARVDKLYLGCLPLQSLKFFFSYALVIANTTKGLQSIKVWVCK
jgi:ribosomal protein S3